MKAAVKKKRRASLPGKLYKLIRIALADLEKCENSDKYRVDMTIWHTPFRKAWACFDTKLDKKVCHVCLAGSVIAQRFKVRPHLQSGPWCFPGSPERKLEALNTVRSGWVRYAVATFYNKGVHNTRIVELMPVPHYGTDKVGFKRELNRIADYLERRDL